MSSAYFIAAISQLEERTRRLLSKIAAGKSPREFDLLAQNCKDQIIAVNKELAYLGQISQMTFTPDSIVWRVILRRYRNIVSTIGMLETTGIMALARPDDDDVFLNRLIERIRHTINYPIHPPVVTSLSRDYFYVLENINLLYVPLAEAHSLLHLPDLYHELAHPLIYERYDTYRVEHFQRNLTYAIYSASRNIDEQQKAERRRNHSTSNAMIEQLDVWRSSWWHWGVELFCDLFATYTLGAAYVWAHLHLCMKYVSDPYNVPDVYPTSHPADDARFRAMLQALKKLGYHQDAHRIEEKWQEYIDLLKVSRTPNYRKCFPDDIIEIFADLAYDGIKKMGCNFTSHDQHDEVVTILNEAWSRFWNDSTTYVQWEQSTLQLLRQSAS